jgi:hypothetical protein
MPRSPVHRWLAGLSVIVLAIGSASAVGAAQPEGPPRASASPTPPTPSASGSASPAPSGSTTYLVPDPSADVPLTTEQLIAVRARTAATGETRTVVAATSVARDVPIRAPACLPRDTDTPCFFGVLDPAPGASRIILVWATPAVAERFRGGDEPVDGVLAFELAGPDLRLLGRVAFATPEATHPIPVDEPSMERADLVPEGRLLAVEGWLGVLGWGVPCPMSPGVLGRQGMESPFVRCPAGWITADGAVPEAVPGRVTITPPGFGIPVQAAAYERFAPDPGLAQSGATPPRLAVYLLQRVANPEPEVGDPMGWQVIGRLDPVVAEDLTPAASQTTVDARVAPPGRLPRRVVHEADGIRVTIELARNPLRSGVPTWVRSTVTNTGAADLTWSHDGCAIPAGVSGTMIGVGRRIGQPLAEAPAYKADTLESAGGAGPITIDFVPEPFVGLAGSYGCADIGISETIHPGGSISQRGRWDGFAYGRLGPVPSGPVRMRAWAGYYERTTDRSHRTKPIVFTFPAWILPASGKQTLDPPEAIDVALTDRAFATDVASVDLHSGHEPTLWYRPRAGLWEVGYVAWEPEPPTMHTVLVDARTGTIARPFTTRPWNERRDGFP